MKLKFINIRGELLFYCMTVGCKVWISTPGPLTGQPPYCRHCGAKFKRGTKSSVKWKKLNRKTL